MSKKRNETHELTVHRMACLAGMLADHFAALCEKQAEVERLFDELVEEREKVKALESFRALDKCELSNWQNANAKLHNKLHDKSTSLQKAVSDLKLATDQLNGEKTEAAGKVNVRILETLGIPWKGPYEGSDFVEKALDEIHVRESEAECLLVEINHLKEEAECQKDRLVVAECTVEELRGEVEKSSGAVDNLLVNTRILDALGIVWRDAAGGVDFVQLALSAIRMRESKRNNLSVDIKRIEGEVWLKEKALVAANNTIDRLKEEAEQSTDNDLLVEINCLKRELGGEGVPIGQALRELAKLIGRANQRDEIKDKFESLLFALGDVKKEKGSGWAQDEIARLRRCASVEKTS